MKMSDYECTWTGPSDYEQHLINIAKEYHRDCDNFDQVNLTGRNKQDEPMSVTIRQLSASNRNAMEVRRVLINKYGLTNKEFSECLKLYRDAY